MFLGLFTCYPHNPFPGSCGGDEEDRTPDPLRARQMLSQLSYTPKSLLRESLSEPSKLNNILLRPSTPPGSRKVRCCPQQHFLPRKEVIQPHLPIRLPCYDFTPVINPTFDNVLLAVRLLASGVTDSHGVTGGVYKARERIHRGMLIRDY